ncbi:hypothetical protein SRABI128_06030 [Microbacterium sp. Bi128]|nr:hypothetical protein SRABI128_06030 [Microbacterium sp. Bi128]
MSSQPFEISRLNPLSSKYGSWLTHHTSGSASVWKGTMRVARIAVNTTRLPRTSIRDRANAHRRLMKMPSTTVTAEMPMEVIRKRAAGTRSNTAA